MAEMQNRSHSTSDLKNSLDYEQESRRPPPVDANLLRLKLSEDVESRHCSSTGTPTPIPTPNRSSSSSPDTPDELPETERQLTDNIFSECLDIDNIHPKKMRTKCGDANGEEADPRIQSELEVMNRSCDDINNLVSQLSLNQNEEKRILKEGNKVLKEFKLQLSEKLVNTARFYYETLQTKNELQMKLNRSATEFEMTKKCRDESRSNVLKAECEYTKLKQSLELQVRDTPNGLNVNYKYQHNQAIEKVNTANALLEKLNHQLISQQSTHKQQLREFSESHKRLEEYRKKNSKAIIKALPYFQARSQYEQRQHDLLASRSFIQKQKKEAKLRYSVALRNLEAISVQIHSGRESQSSCSIGLELVGEPSYLLDGDSVEGSSRRELAQSRQSLHSLPSFQDIHEMDRFHVDLSKDKSSSVQYVKGLDGETEATLKLL